MKEEWFDRETDYLLNPPMFREVLYSEFKKFYTNSSNKKEKILQALESYCQKLRAAGFGQEISFMLVSGAFLKKNNGCNKINILPICNNSFKIDSRNEYKYFNKQGEVYKKYLNSIWLEKYQQTNHVEGLENHPNIKEFSMEHELDNPYKKIGMILLSFENLR